MISKLGIKQSKIVQILLAPINILSKGAQLYTRSMMSCAGRLGYSNGPVHEMEYSQLSDLPRSFTINSYMSPGDKEEEHRMLLRTLSRKMNLDLHRKASAAMGCSSNMGRSYSVGIGKIGRIDEERPCSFREDDVVEADVYPRSRSNAVRRKALLYK